MLWLLRLLSRQALLALPLQALEGGSGGGAAPPHAAGVHGGSAPGGRHHAVQKVVGRQIQHGSCSCRVAAWACLLGVDERKVGSGCRHPSSVKTDKAGQRGALTTTCCPLHGKWGTIGQQQQRACGRVEAACATTNPAIARGADLTRGRMQWAPRQQWVQKAQWATLECV